MTYTYWKSIALGLLLTYFVVGIYAEHFRGGELYPVFSWQLFSEVPNTVATYTIEIHKLGNENFDPPLKFSQSDAIFESLTQSPTDYEQTIVNLGVALDLQKDEDIEHERVKLEKIFQSRPYSYTILYIRYDSLEFWKTREYNVLREVGAFSSDAT